MHIAILHPFLHRYARGIERYTVNLSNALVRLGISVDILTWRWSKPLYWAEQHSRVRLFTFPTSPYFAAKLIVPFYMSHLRRYHYDRLFIHFPDYGEATTLNYLRRLGTEPEFTIVLHYPYSEVPHRYHSFVRAALPQRAVDVVAVSQHVADEAHPSLGRECVVISHGVDTERFRPDASMRIKVRADLGLADNSPLLLTVSALEDRKGVQWMLRALPLVIEQLPGVNYLVVGDGPYRTALQKLADELGLSKRVHFLSSRSDVARFYQAADLFIILSKGEASSLVSLEAMACQLTVIASCHRPFNELVTPDWGQQVDETNVENVAKAVTNLLADSETRTRLGLNGRTHILSHHTWKRIAEQYLSLL